MDRQEVGGRWEDGRAALAQPRHHRLTDALGAPRDEGTLPVTFVLSFDKMSSLDVKSYY